MRQGFWDRLGKWGDRPALVFAGQPAISYADLAGRVDSFAKGLKTGGKLIAIEAARSEHPVIAYLACIKAGCAAALLPPNDAQAMDAFKRRFSPDFVYRQVGGRWRLDEQPAENTQATHPDLALLLITSGSSGNGKAVRLSADAVGSNAAAIGEYLDLSQQDRATLVLPWHYSYGLSVLNSHLAVGASVFVAGSILDAGFAAQLRDYHCTNLSGVPSSFDLLETIGFRAEDLPDLRFMTVAGGRMEPASVMLYERHLATRGQKFFVMYGQTEATARIAYLPAHLAADHPDHVGRAVPGGELSLIDQQNQVITEPGIAGELVYRGPNVMMGYAGDRADLARGQDIDELRTGDFAIADKDGLYRIVGRANRMSKIAGIRIGHDSMEAALAAAGIRAAVIGDDQSLLAVFTSAQPPETVREELAKAANLSLASVSAVAKPTLPLLGNGKLDYQALKDLLPRHRPKLAVGIVEAFDCAFFPRRTSTTDSFMTLGGDSLRHLQLSMELDRRLGFIPPDWEKLSIGTLAALDRQKRDRQLIGTDLVIRALAILLVVTQHATLWPIPGGSAAMVVLIGYNLARFQRDTLVDGDFGRFLKPLIAVLIPYYLIVGAYALAWGTVPWASVALAGNFGIADPERHTMLPFLYWFVEAFVQIMIIWTLVFSVSPVRRIAKRNPFKLGILMLAAAVLLRFGLPQIWTMGGREIFALHWVLYLAAFGWCAAFAETRSRRMQLLVSAAGILVASAYFGGNWTGSWVRYGLQFAVICALLYLPSIELPSRLASAVLPIAVASYHIYLVHRFVPELLLAPFQLQMPQAVFTALAILGGIVVGIAAQRLQLFCTRSLARLTQPRLLRRAAEA